MSLQNRLRVGVIGCGYWGSKHVRALSSLESVAKVSVIEPNAERADAILVPSCTERIPGYHRVRTGSTARALENTIVTVRTPYPARCASQSDP